jgi:hypothetical protein
MTNTCDAPLGLLFFATEMGNVMKMGSYMMFMQEVLKRAKSYLESASTKIMEKRLVLRLKIWDPKSSQVDRQEHSNRQKYYAIRCSSRESEAQEYLQRASRSGARRKHGDHFSQCDSGTGTHYVVKKMEKIRIECLVWQLLQLSKD